MEKRVGGEGSRDGDVRAEGEPQFRTVWSAMTIFQERHTLGGSPPSSLPWTITATFWFFRLPFWLHSRNASEMPTGSCQSPALAKSHSE